MFIIDVQRVKNQENETRHYDKLFCENAPELLHLLPFWKICLHSSSVEAHGTSFVVIKSV